MYSKTFVNSLTIQNGL